MTKLVPAQVQEGAQLNPEVPANKISVYESIGGWKAVELGWTFDMGGYWEPVQIGVGAYANREDAIVEARAWAKDARLELDIGNVR